MRPLNGNISWFLVGLSGRWESVRTGQDVLPEDADVVVPVRAALLVVEAQGVQQLVLDGVVVQAALTVQRHQLRVANPTHVGITPAMGQESIVRKQAGRSHCSRDEIQL